MAEVNGLLGGAGSMLDQCWTYVNYGLENELKVYGYKKNLLRYVTSWLCIILTLGFLRLLFFWKPGWWIWFSYELCSLEDAECLLIKDVHEQWFVQRVKLTNILSLHNWKSLVFDDRGNLLDDPEFASPVPVLDKFSLPTEGGAFTTARSFRYFKHQKLPYIWDASGRTFKAPNCLDVRVPCEFYHGCQSLVRAEVLQRRAVFGLNQIVVKLKPIVVLLFQEVFTPFYLFQIFSISLWIYENYRVYAVLLFVMSATSVILDVYQIRKNAKALRDTLHSSEVVTVERDGVEVSVNSMALVPGDLIHIPKNFIVQCDAVLLNGSCIVNESMLTGESVPVTKTPIPFETILFHAKEHAKHTLFSGTRVIQTRPSISGGTVKAIVIRTGFYTTKGSLVRSIMFPKPVDFAFTKDLFRMIGLLAIIAFGGFLYTVISMSERGISPGFIVVKAFDLVTIVVPPALPAVLTIGIMLAANRLKKRRIYCISPNVINTCGGIDCVVFDKTGTLTEDGLDFHCALPCTLEHSFDAEIVDKRDIASSAIASAMGSCHSLTLIDGELVGEPLDLIGFQATSWEIEETHSGGTVVRAPAGEEILILRQFPFASSLQRMAVITQAKNTAEGTYTVYCKGSPEKIASLARPNSLPSNFTQTLQRYTKHGYRVIAFGYKHVDLQPDRVQRVPRDEIEKDLILLGLVVLENRLKPETTPVMQQLLLAQIRCVMATGDNLLTAVSVARECGLVPLNQDLYTVEAKSMADGSIAVSVELAENPHEVRARRLSSVEGYGAILRANNEAAYELGTVGLLDSRYQYAMSGDTYAMLSEHFPAVISKLMCSTAVFARMSPEQKALLVNHLQECEYIVAMCGDGANDCGALKAAHAGISLSEAEASIASPFTSQQANIECVPMVIREGRAALVTSFGLFKYMAGYSMCEFLSVSMLYSLGSNLAQYQFLYEDLFIILLLGAVFGYTDAYPVLYPKPPSTRMLSVTAIASLLGQILTLLAFQLFVFIIVAKQPWFVPFTDPGSLYISYSYETTALFIMDCFQLIAVAVINSKSFPYRRTILNNRWFTVFLLFIIVVTVWVTLHPAWWFQRALDLEMPRSFKFRGILVLLGFLNFLVMFAVEEYLVDGLVDTCCGSEGQKKRTYKTLIKELSGSSPRWIEQLGRKEVPSLQEVNEDTAQLISE